MEAKLKEHTHTHTFFKDTFVFYVSSQFILCSHWVFCLASWWCYEEAGQRRILLPIPSMRKPDEVRLLGLGVWFPFPSPVVFTWAVHNFWGPGNFPDPISVDLPSALVAPGDSVRLLRKAQKATAAPALLPRSSAHLVCWGRSRWFWHHCLMECSAHPRCLGA